MLDGHLVRIGTGKHRIELIDTNTSPVHSDLYRVGPKNREFGKIQIDKLRAENIIGPT